MAALDTNVVVRLLVGDDAKQARAAENVASRPHRGPVGADGMQWVLRAVYRLDRR